MNQDALRLDREIDLRSFDPGEIDTYADAFFAAVSVDRGLPGVGRKLKFERASS